MDNATNQNVVAISSDAIKQAIKEGMKALLELHSDAASNEVNISSDLIPGTHEVNGELVKDGTETECTHPVWRRGILPGGKYVKSCAVCGSMVEIPFDAWQVISDR